MPESRTAQLILLQFTLNKVRAASPLTDGTERSSAGIAFRFSEICQICDASFSAADFGLNMVLNASPRRFTIGSGVSNCDKASPAPSERWLFLFSVAAHRMIPARLIYRSNDVNEAKSSVGSAGSSSVSALAQLIIACTFSLRRLPLTYDLSIF